MILINISSHLLYNKKTKMSLLFPGIIHLNIIQNNNTFILYHLFYISNSVNAQLSRKESR